MTLLVFTGSGQTLYAALPELFPVEDLRPGLRGKTHTVMQGTEIITLETEILGVLKNGLGPGKDLIIGKLIDEKSSLTGAVHGAVHGMSGSPLYIDGKLVGALSRRLMQFEKDGHCGFTPIRDMLDVQNRGREKKDFDKGPSPFLAFWGRGTLNASADLALQIKPDNGQWLAVPLNLSGFSESMISSLRPLFSRMTGFLPVASGSAGPASLPITPIRPGSALSVLFIDGDIRAGGTGTATTVDGNKVTAFGHPMMGIGPTELPLAGAEIITTMPSYAVPHKISNIGPAAGTIWQDRLSAISGETGRLPVMATYEIRRKHENEPRPAWKGTFVKEEWLAPQVIMLLMARSLMDQQDFSREATLKLEGELRFKGLPPLSIKGLYSGGSDQRLAAIFDQMAPLMNLYQAFPRQIDVESLTLSVESFERSAQWEVETVNVRNRKLRQGEKIQVLVRLKNGLGGKRLEELSLEVPEELKKTAFRLRVASGSYLQAADANMRGMAGIANASDYLRAVNRLYEPDALYLQAITLEQGVLSRNSPQLGLPYSVGEVVKDSEREALRPFSGAKVWSQRKVRLSGIVSGFRESAMEIE